MEMQHDNERSKTKRAQFINTQSCLKLPALTLACVIPVVVVSVILAVNSGDTVQPPTSATTGVPTEASWQRQPISKSGNDLYSYNAIATDSAVCSKLADKIINVKGGNAMDAAVTALVCAGIYSYHNAGIGGGGFMQFYNRSQKAATTYNFRERAPINASRDMYKNLANNASLYGGLAVGVPGEVSGLHTAHSQHGRLPWRELVMPVVQLLRNGHRVIKPLADSIKIRGPIIPGVEPFTQLRNWIRNPSTGTYYKAGEILRNEKMAVTLEKIANDPMSFYTGELADEIVREIQQAGGIVSKDDLMQYETKVAAPIGVRLRSNGLRLHTMSPPSSGAVLSIILNILDGFQQRGSSVKSSLSTYATFLHRIAEACKFGYAKRSALGDEQFVNVSALLANLTSDSYADELRRMITDDRTHDVNYYGPSFEWKEDSGTTHISIVDSDGNAVSVTSTINTGFGSLVRGNTTGIIYNNAMDDFSTPNRENGFGLPASPSNYISPRKRPMSSMTPVIVTNDAGDVQFVSGASGGTRITTAIAYNLARQMFLNETVKEAADSFRIHHQLVPNEVEFFIGEFPIPEEIRRSLEAKGHKFGPSSSFSVVNGISRLPNGMLQANTDFRKLSKTSGV